MATALTDRIQHLSVDEILEEAARVKLLHFSDRMVHGYLFADHIRNHLIPALEWATSTPNARLIVTMPPRHSKSLHVSENLPAWYLGRHPHKRVIGASHTASLAYTFSRRVRNKIADPRWPFPDVQLADDKAAVQSWDTNQGGGYIAVGVGGSPTGHGADLIIIDDPIRSAADADSATVRAALHEWYRETMRTRLEPGGSIVITATRWHTDDLTGMLLNDMTRGGEQWRHVHLPAIDESGRALWPERWTVDALDAIKRSVGSRAWEAQYQGVPQPAGGGILKRWWLRYWQYPGQDLERIVTKDGDGREVAHPLIDLPGHLPNQMQSWDLSFQKTDDGSYVVGLQAGMNDALVFLLDRFKDHTDFPGTLRAFMAMGHKWPGTTVKLVENKANGPALMSTLQSKVSGIVSVHPQGSKEARMHAISPFVEGGGLVLPHPDIAPWVNDYVDQITTFPMAKHDDDADATSQLIQRITADFEDGMDDVVEQFLQNMGVY